MRFIILSIGLLLAFAPSRAQRQLDLKQCREMALEYSKQLAIAEKQKEKAVDQERIRGQLFAETFCIGLLSVSSEKAGIQIKRGVSADLRAWC